MVRLQQYLWRFFTNEIKRSRLKFGRMQAIGAPYLEKATGSAKGCDDVGHDHSDASKWM